MNQPKSNTHPDSAAGQGGPNAYVPPLERIARQPPPMAASPTWRSIRTAMQAPRPRREAQALAERLANAPPGLIETEWGPGFRGYDECLSHIRASSIGVAEGELAVPLRYSVHERQTYSIVSSHAVWRDPARAAEAEAFREGGDYGSRCLYFPVVMRDARRVETYYPGLSSNSAQCIDRLDVSLAHCESKCTNFYDAQEVERVFYPELEQLMLDFFPGSTDALVYNHDAFYKDYDGDLVENQDNKAPGVNTSYANIVHNDLNDNSGRVRCRELLTRNLRNFVRAPALHHRLPHLRRPYRRGHPAHLPPRARVVLDSPAEAHEVSMLKCYDSVIVGSVSR